MSSLCHSADNKQCNNFATLYPIGLKFFLHPFGQKNMSQIFFLRKGLVWLGAKKTVICQAISEILKGIVLRI